MKGANVAAGTVATDFVLVVGQSPNVAAWMSPRGKAVFANCNRWTLDPKKAHVYRDQASASRAIDRMVKGGWAKPGEVKYCTYGEYLELLGQ